MASERTVSVERSPSRCPYCHDELDKTQELVACAACGARHHAACHTAHGACVSCGASELLVPARRRPRAPAEPLPGSKIRVRREEGGATIYEWDPRGRGDLVLILLLTLLVLTIPLAWLTWLKRRRFPTSSIRVTPEAIEFTAHTFRTQQVRLTREEVGAIRVGSVQGGGVTLSIDQGITRHTVLIGIVDPGLAAPELEWLADQLVAWRDEA